MLSLRSEIDIHFLAEEISAGNLNLTRVEEELRGLAKALKVDARKLRPDDVVSEILGVSVFTGDDLIEIEARLQKRNPDIAEKRLTVREVVSYLAT